MAIHAPFHGHLHPWFGGWTLALADISVTSLTLQFAQNDMASVRKEDMIRLFIDAFPWNWGILLLKLPDLFFFWAFRNRFLMTFKASVDVRHSRKALGFKEAVACVAAQTLFQMFFMIEGNGLLGLRTKTEVDEEE